MATTRRVIRVTRRQVEAAQTAVQANRLLGRPTDETVQMIANARAVETPVHREPRTS